jgi:hypothetical protein
MAFQLDTDRATKSETEREMKRRRRRKLYSKASSFIPMNQVDAGRETARHRHMLMPRERESLVNGGKRAGNKLNASS